MKKSPNPQERRRHPRFRVTYLASCINSENGIQQLPIVVGRVLDISPSGVKVEVHAEVRAGTDVRMRVAIQETEVEVTGKVVHSSPGAGQKRLIGIEFDELVNDLCMEA